MYGREANTYTSLVEPNLNVFDEHETILLRKIGNKYKNLSTDEIVGKSHLEEPWLRAKSGAELVYEHSFDIEDFDEELEKEYAEEDKSTIAALDAAFKGA